MNREESSAVTNGFPEENNELNNSWDILDRNLVFICPRPKNLQVINRREVVLVKSQQVL